MNYKKIEGYENYMVSETGMILNIKRNKHLVNVIADRYMIVLLYKKNKRKRHYVHRLVAQAFCQKQEGKKFVNHKDLNKHNNNSFNLEWVTAKENTNHFISSANYTSHKKTKNEKQAIRERLNKKVLCLKTNKVFESMGHFAKYKGVSLGQASQKLNNIYINNLDAVFMSTK
jgi:hypothetical protein